MDGEIWQVGDGLRSKFNPLNWGLICMRLGERQFTDGTTRPVFRSDDGRQFVLDYDGEPGYGVSLNPEKYSEPVVLALRP